MYYIMPIYFIVINVDNIICTLASMEHLSNAIPFKCNIIEVQNIIIAIPFECNTNFVHYILSTYFNLFVYYIKIRINKYFEKKFQG